MACSTRKPKRGNKKPSKLIFGKTDLEALRSRYRFSDHELLEFKQRFTFLSNEQDMLNKAIFRENMGLLGLDTGAFLADRIFGALDWDKDGYIGLEEYLKYFDILIYGSPAEKHELTFKMIDLKGKGWFSYEEFKNMILSMLYTWNSLTGSNYNINQNAKLDDFLINVFKRFDIENHGSVTLQTFLIVVDREPQLLEIFDSFNQGILDSVQPNEVDQKDLEIIDELEHLYGQLNKLREFVDGKGELEVPQPESMSKSHGPLKVTPMETLRQPEVISPRLDLRTPIVSTLDLKMKRTKIFEFFKEDRPEQAMITRQKSEVLPETPMHQRLIDDVEGKEFQRRNSYVAVGTSSKHYTHRKSDEFQEDRRQSRILEKMKTMEIIQQEGNSAQLSYSPTQPRGQNFRSSFRYDRPDEKKNKVESPDLTKQMTREASFRKSVKANGEVYNLDQVQIDIMTLRGDPNNPRKDKEIAVDTSPKQIMSSPSNPPTPSSKKLMIRIDSIRVAQKDLGTELDQPICESAVPPVGLTNPANITVDLNNMPLHKSMVTNLKGMEARSGSLQPPVIRLNTGQLEGKLTNGLQAIPLQQLTEQLESLARETLKIIDEVRNKKKGGEAAPEVKEEEKKATVQNVPKVHVTDRKSNYVAFGHQNWNLVLNMMLGIQQSIKSLVEKTDNFTEKDFKLKYIFDLIPKRTNETKDSYKICTFFDYAPNIFWEIRRQYGIKNDDYLRSIGPETMLGNLIKGNLTGLSELTSTGKSGSFFYYSADGKYTLKTISRDEFHFFRKILSNYYTHMINNPQSMMIKFFGLHKIRFLKNKKKKEKVYFIIMANVFQTKKEIHVRYDLKGSTKGRYSDATDPTVAKKDINILRSGGKIKLPMDYADSFLDIIEKDSKFFEENHIIDYSLLMGVHYLTHDELVRERARDSKPPRRSLMDSKIQAKEGVMSWDGTKIYFFGIIDILTEFNAKKKAEYVVKRVAMGKGISAVPPHQYAERFRNFIGSLVMKPL